MRKGLSLSKKSAILFLTVLTLGSVGTWAQVLNVPQCYQEQNQWCWAGCTQAILAYYGKNVAQNDIAWHGSRRLNIWIWLWGQTDNPYRSSIQNLLGVWGIPGARVESALSQASVQVEISQGRPVQVRWGWDSGGGHFVVCKGIQGGTVYVMDPWYGPTVNSYGWMVRGSGHTWTHTLLVNRTRGSEKTLEQRGNTHFETNWDMNPEKLNQWFIIPGTIVERKVVVLHTTPNLKKLVMDSEVTPNGPNNILRVYIKEIGVEGGNGGWYIAGRVRLVYNSAIIERDWLKAAEKN